MTERPIPLFVPPAVRLRSTLTPPPAAVLPRYEDDHGLRLAIARIDHSGRVGDRRLAELLGWRPGDRHDVRMLLDGAVVSKDADGRFQVNERRHVFVPAGVRRILAVDSGDPVVLVARPKSRTLLVHSTSMVASLLFRHYATHGVFHA